MSIDIINLRVEDAIAEHVAVGEDGWFDSEEAAEAAIAAATPHIRAALFDELIDRYDKSHYPFPAYYSKQFYLDWLRSQKEQDQP